MKVWLLSQGDEDEGSWPVGVFSSEEKAKEKAIKVAQTELIKADKNKKEEIENIQNPEMLLVRYFDNFYPRELLWEETELDKDMR